MNGIEQEDRPMPSRRPQLTIKQIKEISDSVANKLGFDGGDALQDFLDSLSSLSENELRFFSNEFSSTVREQLAKIKV